MTLKEQMAADASLFTNTDEFGEEVEWTAAGAADPLADPVKISFHLGSVVLNGQLVAVDSEATLLVPVAAVPDPSGGASFVRSDGNKWTVDQTGVSGSDGVFWKLAAHRDSRPTLRGW